jgi:Kef-type K+ transport system membrane component KefB
MSPFLQFGLLITILLVLAKIAGYISIRLKQPSVLGELLVGVLVGPSFLNIINLPIFEAHLEEPLHFLSEIGVLLLMFMAGLELHFSDLIRNGKVSAYSGTLGVILPVGLGILSGRLFGFDSNQSIFLGLTLGATSVSISVQTLIELRVLRSRVGLSLLGAAVFDDILVILLLSIFLALGTEDMGPTSIVLIALRVGLFFVVAISFGWWVLPRLVRIVSRLPISEGVLALALSVLIVYGLAAEIIGDMTAITGSFLAGLMFSRTPEKETLERSIHALSYGLFVPIFFISIGLAVNIRQLTNSDLGLVVVITVVAILGKVLGAGTGARLAGLTSRESLQLGTGMVSRGEVGLILATVGIDSGLMQQTLYSDILAMVLFTTLITPPALRFLFRSSKTSMAKQRESLLEKELN